MLPERVAPRMIGGSQYHPAFQPREHTYEVNAWHDNAHFHCYFLSHCC